MARNKTARARIEDTLRADFDWALDYTGLGESQFIEAAIKALVEEVREKGEIRLPLALISKAMKGAPAPPEKSKASGMQSPSGQTDVGAARGGSRSTGFAPSSPEEIPVRETRPPTVDPISTTRPRSSREVRPVEHKPKKP